MEKVQNTEIEAVKLMRDLSQQLNEIERACQQYEADLGFLDICSRIDGALEHDPSTHTNQF
ncbi:MAG: hypothetical protein CMF46_00205 [Legionellales bacterium]|nr:hypothetical protein [Legionellales bacterium]